MSLSANVNEKAALIWAIADKLTGVYKPHEYGEVILPLTVIRRFDCYTKITVERPLLDENGKLVLKKGRKEPDTNRRDTENVPLKKDIDTYFKPEVLPFAPDAWIDKNKSKVGYEIPFTRYFYKYEAPKPSDEIMVEIMELTTELSGSLEELFAL